MRICICKYMAVVEAPPTFQPTFSTRRYGARTRILMVSTEVKFSGPDLHNFRLQHSNIDNNSSNKQQQQQNIDPGPISTHLSDVIMCTFKRVLTLVRSLR